MRNKLLLGILAVLLVAIGVGLGIYLQRNDFFQTEGANHDDKASEKAIFKGTWDGSYRDDQGDTGSGKYEFHDEKEGQLKVTVSWTDKEMKLHEMELQGKRLGLNAVYLEGKYCETTYRYLGRMKKGKLVLPYLSIEENTGKSGSGVSTLTRASP